MTVSEGPATKGMRAIRKDYPKTKGLILGTTKLWGRIPFLKPKTKSLISAKSKVGMR